MVASFHVKFGGVITTAQIDRDSTASIPAARTHAVRKEGVVGGDQSIYTSVSVPVPHWFADGARLDRLVFHR